MNLRFTKQHKSIKDLPSVAVPNFTVITGTNGSGKTHLLEAIKNGAVVVTGCPRTEGSVLPFDWTSFAAKVSENASPDQVHQQRENAITTALQQQNSHAKQLPQYFLNQKIAGHAQIADPAWLANASDQEIESVLLVCTRRDQALDEGAAAKFRTGFAKHRDSVITNFRGALQPYGDLATILERQASQAECSLLTVDESTLRDSFPLTWNATNTLQVEFAGWFSAWHATYEYNKVNEYYHTQRGETDRHYLSDEVFRQKYGNEPWDIANSVLLTAGFRHRFSKPTHQIGNLAKPFQLRLIDPDDGTELKTTELSSGEKILLAITLMLYQSTGDLGLVNLPKLLLLDEVDAPLHPSFTRSLIETLADKFVGELDVAVIMTTHSPSTVALAPEESVYELVRRPRELRKTSISAATQILSAGFVSVTPTDIVVITESRADPEYYQPLYSKLIQKELCNPNPPLSFLAASKPGDDGTGGGSSQVRNWAPKLHDLGLDRFRGLIDKDGTNQPDSIISVLNRYSIENYLFDPLTLTAYLIHRGIPDPFGVAAADLMQIRDFIGSEPAEVMPLVLSLCTWLASQTSTPQIASSSTVPCDYVGFAAIGIPEWWLNTRGHDIETSIRAPLNILGNNTGRGALLKVGKRDELIRFQSTTYPELISKDFISIFDGLRTVPLPTP
jgi:energy-coupling factor transporter ATP-binding protein EcfA2